MAGRSSLPLNHESSGSLSGFHKVFVACAALLGIALGLWGTIEFLNSGGLDDLAIAVVGWCSAVVLVIYGRWFVHKMQSTL